MLHLVERENLTHARRLAIPCVAPQIVGHAEGTVWVTGRSPRPGPMRCDLFGCEVFSGKVVVETAELEGVRDRRRGLRRRDGRGARGRAVGVYATTARALRELVELHGDEVATAIACRHDAVAAFVHGRDGTSLVVGHDRVVIPLRSPAHSARFLAWSRPG